MSTKTTNIVVIEDHEGFRKGLMFHLKKFPEFRFIGEADNGQEALTLIAEKKPDIALMDFHMPMGPGPDKLELIQESKKLSPKTKLIIITGELDPYLLSLMVHVGADSLVLKNDVHEPGYLSQVIQRTHQGKYRLTKRDELNYEINQATEQRGEFMALMNDTELQVIFLLCKGHSSEKIAKEIKKSPDYIRHVLRHAREKYHLETNDQLKQLYRKLFPIQYFPKKLKKHF